MLFSLSSISFLSFLFGRALPFLYQPLLAISLCFLLVFQARPLLFFRIKIFLIIFFQLLQPIYFCFTFNIAAMFFLKGIYPSMRSFNLLSYIFHLLSFFFFFRGEGICLSFLFFHFCQSLALFLNGIAVLGNYFLSSRAQFIFEAV